MQTLGAGNITNTKSSTTTTISKNHKAVTYLDVFILAIAHRDSERKDDVGRGKMIYHQNTYQL
jgi:hypothetical protein